MELSIKKHLKALSKQYKERKLEFEVCHEQLIKQFKLKKGERKQVFYGMLIPANRSLKKFTDILNSDSQLIKLSDEIKDISLTGNILLIKTIRNTGISIPGYDIDSFIESPFENFQEIENLTLSLSGYEHIHIIEEKILLEIPARHHLEKHNKILKLVDYWIKKT